MRFAQRLGCHPLALEAGLAQILLSLCQRPLSLGELFPEPMLTLTLGLEPRECIGVLSSARLGQGLDRLSQELPCPGSPDVSGENKKELRVPIEGFGELYEGFGNGPLDLARLDPADLRSREAAPPGQPGREMTTERGGILPYADCRIAVPRSALGGAPPAPRESHRHEP